jgi:hypothetical protein
VCVNARPGSATRTDKPYQGISRTVRLAGSASSRGTGRIGSPSRTASRPSS